LYRHPNSKTPFFFYSDLFATAATYKYSLVIGYFNAWGDSKIDSQGEVILRAYDSHSLIILNDDAPTFLSSSDTSNSSIDLSISSRDLRLFSSASTLPDLHGSDHYPISISITKTSPAPFRYAHKLNLSDPQLSFLHCRLINDTPKFRSSILHSPTPLHSLRKYDLFCSLLLETVSSLFPSGFLPPKKKHVPIGRFPSLW